MNAKIRNLIPYVVMCALLTAYAIWLKHDEAQEGYTLVDELEVFFENNIYSPLGEVMLIDIRTSAEYQRGHLNRAYHMPQNLIEREIPFLVIKKDTPVVIYGRNARRTANVKTTLEGIGYSNILNLNEVYERDKKDRAREGRNTQ